MGKGAKILVTGVARFIGVFLCKKLLENTKDNFVGSFTKGIGNTRRQVVAKGNHNVLATYVIHSNSKNSNNIINHKDLIG